MLPPTIDLDQHQDFQSLDSRKTDKPNIVNSLPSAIVHGQTYYNEVDGCVYMDIGNVRLRFIPEIVE